MYNARIFALGAIVAVCGVVGGSAVTGCTTTVEVITLDASWDSSSADSQRPGKKDASVERDDGGVVDASKRDAANDAAKEVDAEVEPTTCPSNVPFDDAAVDAEIGTYRIGVRSKSCSAAEIAQIQSNLGGAGVWSDVVTGVGASCADCVLTSTGDTTWGPIVTLSSNPASGFFNWGACHAALNNSAACGRAFQYTQFCAQQACADCASAAEEKACTQAALSPGGVCNAIMGTINTLCPNFANSDAQCGATAIDNIRALCGP